MIHLRQGHHDAEVVIAGAGPAGAAAAAHLARAGIRVVLLDQSRFPREFRSKTAGERQRMARRVF